MIIVIISHIISCLGPQIPHPSGTLYWQSRTHSSWDIDHAQHLQEGSEERELDFLLGRGEYLIFTEIS